MNIVRWKYLAAPFAGLLAVGPALAQTTLTMSSWVPQQHLLTRAMVDWAQQVEKASDGRLKFNLLPKPVVAAPGTYDAVKDGLVDISFITHGYTPGRFVLTKVAEFPGLGDSSAVTSVAYQRIFERYLAKAGEHQGVKVLTVFTHGPGLIMNTKRPIRSVADLAGLKMRIGGGVIADITQALGMSPLLKPAPESYELLSNGVADGTLFPMESLASFKLEKVIKYVTRVPGGLYNTSFAMLMNQDRFNKLAREDQQAIERLSGEYLARLIGGYWDNGDRVGLEAALANGVQVASASAELMREIRQRTAGIEQAWVKEVQAKGVDGARVLAEFRTEIARLSAAK